MQEIRTVFDPQDVETRTIEELGRTLSNVYRKQYERIGENLRPLGITSLHSVILVNLFRYPGLNHQVEVRGGILQGESSQLLKGFFNLLRNYTRVRCMSGRVD
jgi:hypothetical protein